MKKLGIAVLVLLVMTPLADAQITLRNIGGAKRKDEAKTKNVHGVVLDQRGKAIAGARVSLRNIKDNTIRTATTDATGNYAFPALPPDVDYEVRADFKGTLSERRVVSALLDREDNLVNFDLNVAGVALAAAPVTDSGPDLQTYDLAKLKASFEMPSGVPAPIPAVLLLHGYGEDRKVWQSFRTQLLAQGWAVMSLDLRGHGDSKTKNQKPVTASPDWRTSSHEFPQDIDPALDWLKKQTRLDSHKIVIIGYDVGANLALIASGKFKEVRTVVAVKPVLKEALEMAGSAQDFQPHSALIITPDPDGAQVKSYVKEPARLLTLTAPITGGTAQLFEAKQLTDAVFQWLKETY